VRDDTIIRQPLSVIDLGQRDRRSDRAAARCKKLDDTKRREIAEAVISGRRTAAQMARMFGISPPTVSRIVAAYVAAGAHLEH
jgi:DNA-binding CsgD family transcriptional regulator